MLLPLIGRLMSSFTIFINAAMTRREVSASGPRYMMPSMAALISLGLRSRTCVAIDQ
jgi:hypothetical protein